MVFLVSMYLIWIFFWVLVNSIEQPIKCNSVGSGDVSHCRTSASNDHLDHCFIVIKHIKASWREDWTFEGTESIFSITLIFPGDFLISKTTLTSRPVLRHTSKNRNNCKQPIQSQSNVQGDDFRFCRTVRNTSLFLAHSTDCNKCMTSENAQCSSRGGFRIF